MATQPLVDAQEMPLLRTKLYIPPLRREQVPRPRLIGRLDAGLRRKLTLISAPAGFGKTTLVSEWVQAMGRTTPPIAIAWLSLPLWMKARRWPVCSTTLLPAGSRRITLVGCWQHSPSPKRSELIHQKRKLPNLT